MNTTSESSTSDAHELNELGQPVGVRLAGWQPPPWPTREIMQGRFCRLEPLEPSRHAAELHAANSLDAEGRMWTYLPYGPFRDAPRYEVWLEEMSTRSDPVFFAIREMTSHRAVGLASYLRIDPAAGSIEVGHLNYSPLLQRTAAATEAMYLMMERAFQLGYRRYEWKCHALNAPSRAAALRLGFTFEGTFRQATVVKGRTRDTVWFSIIDREWPARREAFRRWLEPANFDEHGRQRTRLTAGG
jgi:RimJ/RimL family protein N-acetyltransferase